MAYTDNQLYAEGSYDPFIRIKPEHVFPKTFAADAGAAELAVGTPVAFDSVAKQWAVWSAAGSNGLDDIRGFVYPKAIQLDASKEVLGTVMVAGEIEYEDIVLPTGETAANLKAALRSGPRERGLWIRGLGEVR
jgi:hypothetical protein